MNEKKRKKELTCAQREIFFRDDLTFMTPLVRRVHGDAN